MHTRFDVVRSKDMEDVNGSIAWPSTPASWVPATGRGARLTSTSAQAEKRSEPRGSMGPCAAPAAPIEAVAAAGVPAP